MDTQTKVETFLKTQLLIYIDKYITKLVTTCIYEFFTVNVLKYDGLTT